MVMILFFFFSSRRRHTRYWRDWSSDVCSSDLPVVQHARQHHPDDARALAVRGGAEQRVHGGPMTVLLRAARDGQPTALDRSEERRVGKEGRSRWSPYH